MEMVNKLEGEIWCGRNKNNIVSIDNDSSIRAASGS